MDIVKTIREVPKEISSIIHKVNDLRNGMAHTFLIEDLSSVKKMYKGKTLTKVDNLLDFQEDMKKVREFFMPFLKEEDMD